MVEQAVNTRTPSTPTMAGIQSVSGVLSAVVGTAIIGSNPGPVGIALAGAAGYAVVGLSSAIGTATRNYLHESETTTPSKGRSMARFFAQVFSWIG